MDERIIQAIEKELRKETGNVVTELMIKELMEKLHGRILAVLRQNKA